MAKRPKVPQRRSNYRQKAKPRRKGGPTPSTPAKPKPKGFWSGKGGAY